mmetsp:Transcript_1507/g.2163  ORF Transcript_1507/g.2163 Transcript_1507/m.2163 type:complete len:302 (-) Transcript_1507:423-1328(-)
MTLPLESMLASTRTSEPQVTGNETMCTSRQRQAPIKSTTKKAPKILHNAYNNTRLAKSLKAQGLRVIPSRADGNCLFDAISRLVDGDNGEPSHTRREIVDFLEENENDFEPFMTDELSFDKYCGKMRKLGTWAGDLEIQAASKLYGVNICIHQHGENPLEFMNLDRDRGFIHLAYEGKVHYNGLRLWSDLGRSKCAPFLMEEIEKPAPEQRKKLILPNILTRMSSPSPDASAAASDCSYFSNSEKRTSFFSKVKKSLSDKSRSSSDSKRSSGTFSDKNISMSSFFRKIPSPIVCTEMPATD